MDASYKEVLRRCHTYLLDNLDVKKLSDYLFQNEVITRDDFERLNHEKTTKDKCRKLLQILPYKNNNAFRNFKRSLLEANLEYIRTHIETEELEIVLEEHFIETTNGNESITLERICSLLKKRDILLPHNEVKHILAARYGKIDGEDRYMLIERTTFLPQKTTNTVTNTGDVLPDDVNNWSTDQVCLWLTCLPHPPSREIINDFKEQEVDGTTLLMLDEGHLKSDFKHVTKLGQRMNLLKSIETLKERKQGPPSPKVHAEEPTTGNIMTERLEPIPIQDSLAKVRMFDSGDPDSEFKYRSGATLNINELKIDDLIYPINMFQALDLTESGSELKMAKTIAGFCCACLNDRTNGRLYFGLNKTSDNVWKIMGTPLLKHRNAYQAFVNDVLRKCFFKDQVDTVHRCVRALRFVKVLGLNDAPKRFVLEIDVVPSFSICENQAFFVCVPSNLSNNNISETDDMALLRFRDGAIKQLSESELSSYMDKKENLSESRKRKEIQFQRDEGSRNTLLAETLKSNLCLCSDKLGNIHPVLIVNKPRSDERFEVEKSNYEFIGNLPWTMVFDFDADCHIYDYVENDMKKVVTLVSDIQQFTDRHEGSKIRDTFTQSPTTSWVFCNGYNPQDIRPINVTEWKKKKKPGFKEALRFMRETIPVERIVVVFLVLSPDDVIFQDAIEEFIGEYRYQWTLISHDFDTVDPLISDLLKRGTIEEQDIENQAVIGLPWEHINETVRDVVDVFDPNECKIPTSSGCDILLKESVLNYNYSDLEIVASNECKTRAVLMSERDLNSLNVKHEQQFYKGKEVSWWNFYFKTHVLNRHVYKKLYAKTENALKGKADSSMEYLPIVKVYLYHLPGAGGTTISKEILWNLRTLYRCCIVRSVQQVRTAKQLLALRTHGDSRARPLLFLLDNPDDNANDLIPELEIMVRQSIRQEGSLFGNNIFFLALICLRKSTLPNNPDRFKGVLLEHDLRSDEILWFQNKDKYLNKQHKECLDESRVTDPKLLISFNIMKSNFDRGFITEMTGNLVHGLRDENERKLLKYIALFNAYDITFTEIPVSVFDKFMGGWRLGKEVKKGYRRVIPGRWETDLSKNFCVLINETPNKGLKHISSLRISNNLLAKEIVSVIKGSSKQTLSSMALDLFQDKAVFDDKAPGRGRLADIIQKVMKMREKGPDGYPEKPFSPLIQTIIESEDLENAHRVLETAFQLTDDPFIAQHISRLHIYGESWERAIEFSKKAVNLRADHSFLWDTYGRIFKMQIEKLFENTLQSDEPLGESQVLQALDNATVGAGIFKRVQVLNEENREGSASNNAGYYGELSIILNLLHCLARSTVFKNEENLKRCLHDEVYFPQSFLKLPVSDEQKLSTYKRFLKSLKERVQILVVRLNDERIQMRHDFTDHYRNKEEKARFSILENIQTGLYLYFGADSDETPDDLDENGKCEHRRRLIKQAAGPSFRDIFYLRKAPDAKEKLIEVFELSKRNIDTEYDDPHDYINYITAILSLALLSQQNVVELKIKFDDVAMVSKTLYEKRNIMRGVVRLEPFLFYVMLNWPRGENRGSPAQIREAIKLWKEAFFTKYPEQKSDMRILRKRVTKIFFLANGSDFSSIASSEALHSSNQAWGDAIWRTSHILRLLKRFEGVLASDGTSVMLRVVHEGYKVSLEIPTSFPIHDRGLLNKKVYFVIGFSWMGPIAYDINKDDPTADPSYLAVNHTADVTRQEADGNSSQKIKDKLGEVSAELQKINRLKQRKSNGQRLKRHEVRFLGKEEQLRKKLKSLYLKQLEQQREDF